MGEALKAGVKLSDIVAPYGLVHAGVVAKTTDGYRFLVQKGADYGDSWQTIVSCTSDHDGNQWTKIKGPKYVSGHKTLSNYIEAGGRDYSLTNDNCQNGAIRMYNLN